MERHNKRHINKVEDLNEEGVVKLLEQWNMNEFVDFIHEKKVDGRKILDVTEGIVKLWRPRVNAKKFISFIEDLKQNPDKILNKTDDAIENAEIEIEIATIESQYQTVRKKSKEEPVTPSTNSIEELIKRLVPAKSFLYRNQSKKDKSTPSYLPMNPASPKKSRKLFRLSSYEYPFFDLRSRFQKPENAERLDKYYLMKRNSFFYINKLYRKPEAKTKYKSIGTTEELSDKYSEDHFYEDLNYNEVQNKENNLRPPADTAVKPCFVKIQELFHSFKIPFLKKIEAAPALKEDVKLEKEADIYENTDSMANMYDSVRVSAPVDDKSLNVKTNIPVEDYLDPVQVNKDYIDIQYKQKDESILGYIMSIFENRFGMRRDTNDGANSEDSDSDTKKDSSHGEKSDEKKSRNMADRPLPVPVENEPYYMNIDRSEAENLLKGQPDGMFVLRPSSQPNHAYTLSVSCNSAVHNVGVRRRPDGRLALGFARRGERSFTSVMSLLRHHKKRRLLLVAEGGVIGATTLIETPQYYQTPTSIPVPVGF